MTPPRPRPLHPVAPTPRPIYLRLLPRFQPDQRDWDGKALGA